MEVKKRGGKALLLGCFLWWITGCATTDLATGTGGTGTDTGTRPITTTQAERSFVEGAASGAQLRLRLSETAQQKTSNLEVREFARLMVTQQSGMVSELKSIAQQLGVTFPGTLRSEHQSSYDQVAKLSGSEFDRAFTRAMEQSFQQDISSYQNGNAVTTNLALRGHILKTTPIMQGQLKLATQLKNILP